MLRMTEKCLRFPKTELSRPAQKRQAPISLPERLNRRGFVVPNVKNRIELGDLQQVVDLLGQIEQLQFATLVLYRGVGADQLADARTVNVVDVPQIEQNFFLPLGEQVFHRVPQDYAAFPQSDPSAAIHNGDAV